MLRSTLRQMASISGRAILAIGLTSATVLALAPSAKASDVPSGDITVNNPAVSTINFVPAAVNLSAGTANITDKTSVGGLTTSSNAPNGYDVKVSSANGGLLKNSSPTTPVTVAYNLYASSASTNASIASGADISTGSGLSLIAATPTVFATVTNSGGSDTGNKVFDIKISQASTSGNANDFTKLASGDYKDTLTFSIVNK